MNSRVRDSSFLDDHCPFTKRRCLVMQPPGNQHHQMGEIQLHMALIPHQPALVAETPLLTSWAVNDFAVFMDHSMEESQGEDGMDLDGPIVMLDDPMDIDEPGWRGDGPLLTDEDMMTADYASETALQSGGEVPDWWADGPVLRDEEMMTADYATETALQSTWEEPDWWGDGPALLDEEMMTADYATEAALQSGGVEPDWWGDGPVLADEEIMTADCATEEVLQSEGLYTSEETIEGDNVGDEAAENLNLAGSDRDSGGVGDENGCQVWNEAAENLNLGGSDRDRGGWDRWPDKTTEGENTGSATGCPTWDEVAENVNGADEGGWSSWE